MHAGASLSYCSGQPVEADHLPDSIGHHLDHLAQRWPDGELVWIPLDGEPRRYRFADIWNLALHAQRVLECQWPERSPIRIAAPALNARVAQAWACYRAGYPVVLAPLDHPATELPPGTQTWSDLAIGDASRPPSDCPACSPFAADRIATYVLTSGTTGSSRFVCISQRAARYRSCHLNIAEFRPDTANLTLFAPHTVTGLTVFFPRAARIICLDPQSFLASPGRLLEIIERERVRYLALSSSYAAIVNQVLAHSRRRWELSSFAYLGVGVEAIVPEVFRELHERLTAQGSEPPLMIPGYGMTETGLLCSMNAQLEDIHRWFLEPPPVSVGVPMRGWQIRVTDQQDQVVPLGQEGHLQVFSSEHLFSSYVGGELDDTAAAHCADGWFRTGDLGTIRDGQVIITGRAKELLIINGANLAPQRIEQSLRTLPGILDRQIYAFPTRGPNSLTDELGIAFVPDPAYPPDSTRATIQGALAREFRLQARHLHPVTAAELPRTQTGKIRRLALASQLTAA
ncbi:MAG: AMP-binding protein [Chromatiaceae bacterium]|nr:AMP-binding protein [Chromatiaceae bacterium]